MTSVEDQLRRYARFVLEDGPHPDSAVPPATRHRRMLVAAAIVFVLLVGGAAIALSARDGQAPITTSPSPDPVYDGAASSTAAKGPLEVTLSVSNTTPGPDEQVRATVTATNIGAEPITIPPLCWQNIEYGGDTGQLEQELDATPTEEDPLALVRPTIGGYDSVFTTRDADDLGLEIPSVVACPNTDPQLLEPDEQAVGEGYLTIGRLGVEGAAAVRAHLTFGDASLPLDPYPRPDDVGSLPDLSSPRSVTVEIPVTAPVVPPQIVTHRDSIRIALELPEIEAWARNLLREGRIYDTPRHQLFRRSGGVWIVEVGYDDTGSGFKVVVDDAGTATVVDLRP